MSQTTPASPAATPPVLTGAPPDDGARWLQELDVEAGALEADVRLRELQLSQGVRLRLAPYYLRADHLHLSLSPLGVHVEGNGVLTFCPCDEPPIGFGFSGGWAAPPDSLIVRNPTLRVFGVPVLWLPYLWLRSPRKIGLTIPEVSYRGGDGMLLGQGVHFPVGEGLELAAGWYTRGGLASSLELATARTTTLARFDYRSAPHVGSHDEIPSGVGLALDTHGDMGNPRARESPVLVWDIDAIRGARGLRTTLDLEPLARPFDRLAAEGRFGPVALGVDAQDPRGSPLDRIDIAQPYAALSHAWALGETGAMNARASAGPRLLRGRGYDLLVDASVGGDVAGWLGDLSWHASLQVDGRASRGGGADTIADARSVPSSSSPTGVGPLLTSVGPRDGRAAAVVAEQSVELSLPLARAVSTDRSDRAHGGPPVVHTIEPLVRATGVVARGGGDRDALAGFVARPALSSSEAAADRATSLPPTTALAAVVAAGARTSLGTFGGGVAPGADPWMGRLTGALSGGTLVLESRRDAVAVATLAASTARAGGSSAAIHADGAVAKPLDRARRDVGLGWLAIVRAEWESAPDGVRIELRGASRGDIPVLGAWSLLGAEAAPRLTTVTGLALPGATMGASLGTPLASWLRIGGDVDAYATTPAGIFRFRSGGPNDASGSRLLDVHSTLRYRHPCGCFRLAVRGGHVVGREGVDVFASLELAPRVPSDPRNW